jgi:post-segregation antitoxin (ccd killing protein)
MLESEQENAAIWLSENGAALESSNEFVAAHGLPLAKHRQF